MSQNNVGRRPNATAGEILRCAQDDSTPSTIAYPLSPQPSPLTTGPSSLAPRPWLLRRADQAFLAALLLSTLAAVCIWRLVQGGWQQRLIEIDQAQALKARFQVDINTASRPELLQLPGIGDTLVQRIIESRQKDGPFTKQDDLLRIRGIGNNIMERIRPYLLLLPSDQPPEVGSKLPTPHQSLSTPHQPLSTTH